MGLGQGTGTARAEIDIRRGIGETSVLYRFFCQLNRVLTRNPAFPDFVGISFFLGIAGLGLVAAGGGPRNHDALQRGFHVLLGVLLVIVFDLLIGDVRVLLDDVLIQGVGQDLISDELENLHESRIVIQIQLAGGVFIQSSSKRVKLPHGNFQVILAMG